MLLIGIGLGLGLGLGSGTGASPSTVQRAIDLSLLLAAVVTPQSRTAEGERIALIRPAWLALLGELEKDPQALHKLDYRKMEELIAAKYEAEGFDEVILTPRSNDLGRDVIATSKSKGTVRIFDQVKAYAPERLVPANDVRALMGVLGYSDATNAVLTTTSDFAPRIGDDPYIKHALTQGLQLVNGKQLLAQLKELAK